MFEPNICELNGALCGGRKQEAKYQDNPELFHANSKDVLAMDLNLNPQRRSNVRALRNGPANQEISGQSGHL